MTTHPARAPDALGAFSYWPEDPFWSFQLIRMVEQASAGGGDFSEIHQVAKDLELGDGESWYAGFKRAGDELETKARQAAGDGHRISARDSYWRATNHHRSAGFYLDPADPRQHDTVVARRRTFQAAAELHAADIEPIEIPYEQTTLPGYRFGRSDGSSGPGPAVITFGGTDAVAEEMYFFIGRALAERGFTVLAMDGPGQGEALRRGIVARHDYEAAVSAAFDFVAARDDVDADQILVVGQSLGGMYATRAAAFEPRLRGVVVWGGLYDVHHEIASKIERGLPEAEHFIGQFRRITGAADRDDTLQRLRPFNLRGVGEQVEVPTLILHGEADMLCPVADARRTYEEIRTDDKELIIYPTGEPGCTHCQVDALPLVQFDICNWLERRLGS